MKDRNLFNFNKMSATKKYSSITCLYNIAYVKEKANYLAAHL